MKRIVRNMLIMVGFIPLFPHLCFYVVSKCKNGIVSQDLMFWMKTKGVQYNEYYALVYLLLAFPEF